MTMNEIGRHSEVYFDVSTLAPITTRRNVARFIEDHFGWQRHDVWDHLKKSKAPLQWKRLVVVGDVAALSRRLEKLEGMVPHAVQAWAIMACLRSREDLRKVRNVLVHCHDASGVDLFSDGQKLRVQSGLRQFGERLQCLVDAMSPERVRLARFSPGDGVLWLEFGDGLSRALSWARLPFARRRPGLVAATVRVGEGGMSLVFDDEKGEEFDVDSAALRSLVDDGQAEQLMRMQKTANLKLGARLRRLREGAGITQQELAGRMQITQPALSKIEAGVHDPRLATLEKYARGLELSLKKLLEAVTDVASSDERDSTA
jgi:DNA-binding XRE family transcriptional regulator